MLKKIWRVFWIIHVILFEWIFILLFSLSLYLSLVIPIDLPEVENMGIMEAEVEENNGVFQIENSWRRSNSKGILELYVEGTAFDRGVKYGKLILEPNEIQEAIFVKQIEEMIPSDFFRFFLKVFVGWFNRDLDTSIPEEFMKEIYGESFYMSDRFDYVAPKFYRLLNYHAAHDIGHALQGMHMVGCTSFAMNNNRSKDGGLIIGRNFDFYVGKEFAEQKLLLICKPDKGYGFVSYSWPGFLGVVSGMNEHGLTVTLNASKSNLPSGAKVPISILAREILQYAKTIDEAYEICQSREVFVSESLLIGSAIDQRAAIIEKSPDGYDIYDPNEDKLICSNHYQSDFFKNTEINQSNIEESDSKYRFDRVNELLSRVDSLDENDVASILRNYLGLNDEFIGYGNPKSVNQFIANHAVIFKPEQKLMWISTDPYQMGEFLCYDLNQIFKKDKLSFKEYVLVDSLAIAVDSFALTSAFNDFQKFKDKKEEIQKAVLMGKELDLSDKQVESLIKLNPESYITYMVLGEFFQYKEDKSRAKEMFKLALSKAVASKEEEKKIENYIDDL